MAATLPNGSVDIIKIINKGIPVRKWIRDSWARKKITEIQQRVAGIVVPTKTSELTNDSGFVTASAIPTETSDLVNDSGFITVLSVPSAYASNPLMDGTASAGSSTAWARGDHVHPSDTNKQDALTTAQLAAVNSGITASDLAVNDASVLCTVTPIVPTLDAGTHSSSYGGCYYYKIGHTVTVHIGVASLTASTDTVIFTLPAGYRPYARVAFVGIGGSMSSYSRHRIDTNGNVHVHSGATSALGYITFDAFS